jgi:hypothetical protein
MFRWKEQTPYSQPGDWVFPSVRLNGKQPRVANNVGGRLSASRGGKSRRSCIDRDDEGRLVDDDHRRFR